MIKISSILKNLGDENTGKISEIQSSLTIELRAISKQLSNLEKSVSKLNNNIDTLLQIRNSESNLNTTPSLSSLSEGNNVEPQESVSSMLNYEEYTPLKFEF